MNYWLIKSEPESYSIDDLERDGKTAWTGVRNYQARNFMRDGMKKGDLVIFYHSSATPPSAVGIAEVASDPYPDPTQFDKKSDYYDPKATRGKPIWFLVDFRFVEKFKNAVSLPLIKSEPKLKGIMLAQTGSRLSVQPVSDAHFDIIKKLGRRE